MSRAHAWLYRKTRGRLLGSIGRQPVLLLTTIGRRTGRRRTTPVQFVPWEDALLVVAANGGRKPPPAWFGNLRASPAVTAQLGATVRELRARVAVDGERERLWAKLVSANPRLATTQDGARRQLPVVVLEPR
jgi:deazaflavin-dependent oxidoreductase (nitroreductase family)